MLKFLKRHWTKMQSCLFDIIDYKKGRVGQKKAGVMIFFKRTTRSLNKRGGCYALSNLSCWNTIIRGYVTIARYQFERFYIGNKILYYRASAECHNYSETFLYWIWEFYILSLNQNYYVHHVECNEILYTFLV